MKKMIIVLFTLMFSWQASAGLLIEPMLGFSLSTGGELTNDGTSDFDYGSSTLGARLGYSFLGVSAGVYYGTTLSGSLEREATGASFDYDASRTDLGVFVGYEFPIMLRVYGQYFLASNLDIDDSSAGTVNGLNYQGREFKGNGTGLGVGFTGLPFLVINFEYRNYTYDESERAGVTNTTNELKTNEVMVSVSVPLDI